MPGTPNQQLTNLLENFANQIPGGTSSQYYQTIFNAIVNSPQALAQYNSAAAASSTPLSAINYNTQSSASEFSPSNNSINFASDMLSTMQSLGYSPAQIANSVTNIAGHEIWHYSNNVEIQQEIGSLNSSLQSSINSWNKANGPQPVDSYVAARQSADLADEANAAIQGWDDVVSAAVAAQNGAPLTQAQITALVQQTPYANTLFNTTTGNALPGITVDESGSIDATSANVQAESAIIGVQPVSGVGTDLPSGTGPIDYSQYYGAAAIEQVCADEAGTAFSVNYSNLNLNVPVAGSGGGTLTTEQVDEALIQAAAPNGGLALGSTAGCTIINSATGGTSTFTQGPNPTVLKFLPDESDPAPDPLTGPPTPPPITGNLSGSGWETVIDTENANPGGTHSDIFGTAASLVESNNFDPITVLPGHRGKLPAVRTPSTSMPEPPQACREMATTCMPRAATR
jgi:hypothetical protein